MQQELKNIFVTKEVAKLAKEKGFHQICAGFYRVDEEDVFPNSIFGHGFILRTCDNVEGFFEAPTHFQLMKWLLKNHEIDVWYYCYDLHDNSSEDRDDWPIDINDALLEALKLVKYE